MASQKQYTIEIRLNEDAELGTAILFFQILIRAMAKLTGVERVASDHPVDDCEARNSTPAAVAQRSGRSRE